MKKIFAIAAVAAALVATVSCNKEKSFVPTTTKSITVGFEERIPDSKTYVQSVEAGTIYWGTTANDKILYVFDAAGTKYNFVSTAEAAEATRTFTCDTWPAGAEAALAVWSGKLATGSDPDATAVSGNTISGLTLASAQNISNAHSFANNANIAVMKPGESVLRNVFGYIRYTVPAVNEYAGIKAVSIEADENLAGNVQVDISGDAPVASIVSGGVKSVSATTRFKNGYQAGTYYLIVPPGTYHNLKITITPFADGADVTDQNAASGVPFTLTAKSAVVVERGKFTDAGELPAVNPNPGGDDDDDDIEWPTDDDAFDYGLAKGATKMPTYPAEERKFYSHEHNVWIELGNTNGKDEYNRDLRLLPLGDVCTMDGVTYYGALYYYGNRMTTNSVPGPSSWMDGYENIIPTSSAISWKINRPGILSYYAAPGSQTVVDRGFVYKLAIVKTVAGDTTAEILYTHTPTAWDPFERKPQNHPEAYFDLEVKKEMLLGIDEAATLYIWAQNTNMKQNVQIHHFPFKWTPTAKETVD